MPGPETRGKSLTLSCRRFYGSFGRGETATCVQAVSTQQFTGRFVGHRPHTILDVVPANWAGPSGLIPHSPLLAKPPPPLGPGPGVSTAGVHPPCSRARFPGPWHFLDLAQFSLLLLQPAGFFLVFSRVWAALGIFTGCRSERGKSGDSEVPPARVVCLPC